MQRVNSTISRSDCEDKLEDDALPGDVEAGWPGRLATLEVGDVGEHAAVESPAAMAGTIHSARSFDRQPRARVTVNSSPPLRPATCG
jgi:hypothetical protein